MAWEYMTGSADWCEANYAWSNVVVEFHNTWSSVAMTVPGVLGVAFCIAKGLPLRFTVLYALLVTVGAGSAWFHASLSYAGQMSDEIPMYVLKILPYPLMILGAAVSYATLTAAKASLFRSMFTGLAIGVIAQEVRLFVKCFSNVTARWMYIVALSLFLFATLCWVVDISYCSTLQALPVNPQLHSVWHLCTSLSCCVTFAWIAYVEAIVTRRQPHVHMKLGILPFVHSGAKP